MLLLSPIQLLFVCKNSFILLITFHLALKFSVAKLILFLQKEIPCSVEIAQSQEEAWKGSSELNFPSPFPQEQKIKFSS